MLGHALGYTVGVIYTVWLSNWSTDKSVIIDGVVNIEKRNMYLGLFGVIAIIQGNV